jgi:hypothetical protein
MMCDMIDQNQLLFESMGWKQSDHKNREEVILYGFGILCCYLFFYIYYFYMR